VTLAAIDEPVLGEDPADDRRNETPLAERIRSLLAAEPFAVLCSQGDGQPYGSVIAYAVSSDLKRATFCTPRATRKYRLITECPGVALVVDNRSRHRGEIRQVEAVTITGRAVELPTGDEHTAWRIRLLADHPYLRDFLDSPSCAMFRVDLVRYMHVCRFQEVSQWIPGTEA